MVTFSFSSLTRKDGFKFDYTFIPLLNHIVLHGRIYHSFCREMEKHMMKLMKVIKRGFILRYTFILVVLINTHKYINTENTSVHVCIFHGLIRQMAENMMKLMKSIQVEEKLKRSEDTLNQKVTSGHKR